MQCCSRATDAPLDSLVVQAHRHASDGLPFVQHGIPLYMEKPLTATLGEAFDFCQAVGPSRRLLQIGLQRRYDEPLCYAKALLDQGIIGDVRTANPPKN